MKKTVIAALLSIIFGIYFSGCAGSDDGTGSPGTGSGNPDTTVLVEMVAYDGCPKVSGTLPNMKSACLGQPNVYFISWDKYDTGFGTARKTYYDPLDCPMIYYNGKGEIGSLKNTDTYANGLAAIKSGYNKATLTVTRNSSSFECTITNTSGGTLSGLRAHVVGCDSQDTTSFYHLAVLHFQGASTFSVAPSATEPFSVIGSTGSATNVFVFIQDASREIICVKKVP